MFRDRIKEEKQRLNISSKSMSERSRMHIPEETISRVLSGKTIDPGVSVVLDLGETVGLAPYEIFMCSKLAAEFRAFLELKSKSEETETERIRIIAENERLKETNTTLSNKIEILEAKLTLKDELLELHNSYRMHIEPLIEQFVKKRD